jgi:putative ubiquitin-RnfH superfamily antitoxin RatB of RatAB toxin-antitoxin module
MTDRGSKAFVEVAAGTAEHQVVVDVPWRSGLTAGEAVEASQIRMVVPAIADLPTVLGRFGQRVDEQSVLEPGDRIDVCRPLVKDPREMRRELLSAGSVMGLGKPWSED